MKIVVTAACILAGLLFYGAVAPTNPEAAQAKDNPQPITAPSCSCGCEARCRELAEQTAELGRRVESAEAYAQHLRDYAVWRLDPSQRDEIANRRGLACPVNDRPQATPAEQPAATTGRYQMRCDGHTCRRVWVSP